MSKILLVNFCLSILACDLNLQEQTTTFIDERPIQVTADGLLKSNPAWSPDGEMIAFSAAIVITEFTQRSFDGVEQAVVAQLEGSRGIGRLKMALSPDGQKLAYLNTQIGHIWIADLLEGSQTLLTQEHSDAREPAWSPDGAWIAYVARASNSGFLDLWMVAATGGAPTRLTTDETHDFSPSWSADGARIAFSRITATTRALWLLNMADGTVEQLTPDSTRSYSPDWSPDGSNIAFVSSINDTTTIWTVAAEGGVARKLTDAFRYLDNPAWSPDGLKIAGRTSSGIVVVSHVGDDIITTPLSELFPIWLPDSESFLATEFINSSNIYVLSLADTVATRLTRPTHAQFDTQPTWFPGENRIAFSRRSAFPFQVQIWTTTYPGGEESLVVEVPPEVRSSLNPDFSPDGSRLAIEYGADIFTIRLETGEIRFLPRTGSSLRDPSWSPDGTQLACISDNSFKIFRVDSNPFRQTAEVAGSFRSISWSPLNAKFGSHIAVDDFFGILITSPNNLELERVVSRGVDPDWSPDATKLAYIRNGEIHILKVFVDAEQ